MAKSQLQQSSLSQGCVQQTSLKVIFSCCVPQHRCTCTPSA